MWYYKLTSLKVKKMEVIKIRTKFYRNYISKRRYSKKYTAKKIANEMIKLLKKRPHRDITF